MANFYAGNLQHDTLQLTVKPSSQPCNVQIILATDSVGQHVVSQSSLVAFTSTGTQQSVVVPVTMPGSAMTCYVFVAVHINGVLIGFWSQSELIYITVYVPCGACNTSCQTGCQLSCQSCNTCQTGCQVSCQTGCQVSCQTGCQVSCQTCLSCQYQCDISCQSCAATCATGCQVSCQGCQDCESPCNFGCLSCQVCQGCDCEMCASCNAGT